MHVFSTKRKNKKSKNMHAINIFEFFILMNVFLVFFFFKIKLQKYDFSTIRKKINPLEKCGQLPYFFGKFDAKFFHATILCKSPD